MPKKKTDNAHIKSVLKTLEVLEQFIDNNQEKGIHELSASTGIPVSTMQRLVNTLEAKGYLMQNPRSHKYRLGLTLYHLYKSFSQTFHWIDEARQYMNYLVQKHGETINMAYLEGKNIVYLTKVDSPHILRPSFSIGTRYPAFCTSLGKCLLAYQPEESVRLIYVNNQLEQLTDKTKTSIEGLLEELKEIRRHGYAVDDEEFQEGLRCLAVPISNRDKVVVASMSVTAPTTRMPLDRLYAIKDDMLETASEISSLIV